MANFKEIAAVLEDILDAAVKLVDGIKSIKDLISSDDNKVIEAKPAEIAAPTKKVVTLEEVRTKLANLSRNDHTTEVKALLRKYGAEKLSLIKPEDYEAILSDAEEIENA